MPTHRRPFALSGHRAGALAERIRGLAEPRATGVLGLGRSTNTRWTAKALAAAIAFGTFLGLLSPSSALGLGAVIGSLFWTLHAFMALAIMAAMEWLALRQHWSQVMLYAGNLCAVPIGLAPVSMLIDGLFGPIDRDGDSYDLGPESLLGEILDIAPLSVVAVSVLTIVLRTRTATATASEPPGDAVEQLQTLFPEQSGKLSGSLVRVTAQDHYCEIVTTGGRALVRSPIADLERALGDLGFRAHRSHWVPFDAIESVILKESKRSLELSNGERLPISRRSYATHRWRLSVMGKINRCTVAKAQRLAA